MSDWYVLCVNDPLAVKGAMEFMTSTPDINFWANTNAVGWGNVGYACKVSKCGGYTIQLPPRLSNDTGGSLGLSYCSKGGG